MKIDFEVAMNTGIKLYVKGYYVISVKTDRYIRLANYSQRNNIRLFQVKNESNLTVFKIFISDHKKLLSFFDKSQIPYEIISKKGLPVLLSKTISKIIICLLLIFTIIFIILSRYIWHIEINGNLIYSDEQIITYLNGMDVSVGSEKKRIHCQDIERYLKENLNNLEWISCSLDKTTLVIDLYDTDKKPASKEEVQFTPIVSDSDCIITDIIPISGNAVCSIGDEVKVGDVLISNEIAICNDYGEEVDKAYVEAIGYVEGLITEEYIDEIPKSRYKKVYDEDIKTVNICFGDASIELFKPKKLIQYDKEESIRAIKLNGNFYLPFSVQYNCLHPYEAKLNENSPEDIKLQLQRKLENHIAILNKKGVEIVENNVKIYVRNDVYIAKGSIQYKKNICYKGE